MKYLLFIPVILVALDTTAATVLDQSSIDFSSSSYVYNGVSMAQTFTPSIGGNLNELDLFVSQGQPSSKPIFVSIENTVGGMPSQVLGTVSLNLTTQNWTWYYLSFGSQNIYLSPGSLYAFVISTDGMGGYANPAGSVEDHYSGGTSLVQNATGAAWETYDRAVDLDFQTFMIPAVPEQPGYASIILAGLGWILFSKLLAKTERV